MTVHQVTVTETKIQQNCIRRAQRPQRRPRVLLRLDPRSPEVRERAVPLRGLPHATLISFLVAKPFSWLPSPEIGPLSIHR